MTPTTIGWILVDGHADGATLAREQFDVRRRIGGVRAVHTSAQATAAVLRVQTMVQAQGQRLRGIGVTWSGDAAAEAALLLESLTEAGLDNVVPIRFLQAAELSAREIAPIVGSEQTAVCVIEAGLATVMMMDGGGDDAPAVAQHAIDDGNDLIGWLATLFAPGSWRPEALVVAGSGTGLDTLAVQLEARLAMPVFAHAGAQLALAHGAALASGPGMEFGDAQLDEVPSDPDIGQVRSRTVAYAGALTMLVAGAFSFVVSLAIALTLQLAPANDLRPAEQVANGPARPPVAQAATPRVAPPPMEVPPPPAAEPPEAPAAFASVREDVPVDGAMAASAAPSAMAP